MHSQNLDTMRVIILFICILAAASTDALNCVICEKWGTDAVAPGATDCSDKNNLPAPKLCVGTDAVCTFTHIKPIDGTLESWSRQCGWSINYDGARNKCQSVNFFGRKMTTCVCDKTKDDPTKACNGVTGLSSSSYAAFLLAFAAILAQFRC